MVTQKEVTRLVFTMDNNKTSTVNLPAPINEEMVDPDSGDPVMTQSDMTLVQAVFQSDDGNVPVKLEIKTVETIQDDKMSFEKAANTN